MKLRNIIVSVIAVCFAMFALAGCASAAGTEAAGTGSPLVTFLPFIVILVVMYTMMIIPENKRKKKAQEMRNNIQVGDKITTIGGLIGIVVHVSGERLTFETGEDRVRIEINKWAVSSNEGRGADKETQDTQEVIGG